MTHAISQIEVEALAAQVRAESVKLLALDCNWGPPISGRFDEDFLRMWVIAVGDASSGRVSLQGAENRWRADSPNPYKEWSIDRRFEFQKYIGAEVGVGLYHLETGTIPAEFVIRYEVGDGQVHYDNNGGFGRNYRLEQYGGRAASVIAGSNALFLLRDITPVTLFWKSGAGRVDKKVSLDRHGLAEQRSSWG